LPKRVLFALTACGVVALSGCGGGVTPAPRGGVPAPFPVESAFDTAVIQSHGNACRTTYTVHRDGTAQRAVQSCGSGTVNTTLSPTTVSKLFSDLQAAQPLSALPDALTVDISVTVSWNDQQTPNIQGSGTNSIEDTLLKDINAVTGSFPSR
jgi:hypothetical protein